MNAIRTPARRKAPAAAQKKQATRMGRRPPPPNETREDRFKRLAQARTVNALRAIRLIGNLATGDYSWTMEQVNHICTTLQIALDETAAKFTREKPVNKLEENFKIDLNGHR